MPLIAGCVVPQSGEDDERTGAAEEAFVADNALSANALSANSLFANALSANALSANTLSPGALSAIQDPGAAGTLSRQLLKYTVSCALDSSQSFAFSWTDTQSVVHAESYPGSLGLATSWATQPLSPGGARFVSACLAARVNYYGTQVIISARSGNAPLKSQVSGAELANYPHIEGAFWGNLFTQAPWLNACYYSDDVANSRAHLRDCAAGHLNTDGSVSSCGMINILGPCSAVCPTLNAAGQYYQACTERPGISKGTTDFVITIGLQ